MNIFETPFNIFFLLSSLSTLSIAMLPEFQGARIALLEPQPPVRLNELHKLRSSSPTNIDLRTFAISGSSQRLFQSIGAWELMESISAPAYQSMQVWDSLGPGYFRFHTNTSSLGWILENRVLQSALYERLLQITNENKNLTLFTPMSVNKLVLPPVPLQPLVPLSIRPVSTVPEGSLAKLTLSNGKEIRSRLVIGADGAMSKVRSTANIGTWGWDYNQKAVVATVKVGDHANTAWQRFLPNGPVAILPLRDNHASIVWSTTPSHADYLTNLSNDEFVNALNTVLTAEPSLFMEALRGDSSTPPTMTTASSSTDNPDAHITSASTTDEYNVQKDTLWLDPLGTLLKTGNKIMHQLSTASFQSDPFRRPPLILSGIGSRASFPLKFMKAHSYIAPRLALVGDAAHVVHPLAGQGMNLGLGDVDTLATLLATNIYNGNDIGSVSILRDYERTRMTQNLLMMSAVDSIKRIFTSVPDGTFGSHLREPLTFVRNIGMLTLNNAVPIKEQLATYAMGGT